MKRFIGLTVLVLIVLTPLLTASAHIAQRYHESSPPVSPTLNAAKQQLNAPQAQFERPEGIHPVGAIERSRRLLPDPVEAAYKLTFTNKEIDHQTDLHYFGARYYHADLPRFISPDPVSGQLEIPTSWNRYLYCRNDPVNKIDPDGEAEVPVIWHAHDKFSDMPYDIFGLRAVMSAHLTANGLSKSNVSVSKNAKQLTVQAKTSQFNSDTKGLRKQLAIHKQRLKDYKKDPEANDNKGFLKNAPNQEAKDKIIQGRIRNLETQIADFEVQIESIENAGIQPKANAYHDQSDEAK